MAQITNQYRELVEDHTTEEVLQYLHAKEKKNIIANTALIKENNPVVMGEIMAAYTDCYNLLTALLEKLKLLDDTPTVVA